MLIEVLRLVGVAALALAVGAMLLVWVAVCAVPLLSVVHPRSLDDRRPQRWSRAGVSRGRAAG